MSALNKFTIQKSFAISAGAGSGKTYTLSRRYINALLGFDYFREDYEKQDSYFDDLKSARVNQIVTITYTEAAALEMKGRIFELVAKIIDEKLPKDDGDYNSIKDANNNISKKEQEYVQEILKKAYTDSSNSKISTIHSYCLDTIKSNSDIARIDTKLDILNDDEKQSELSKIIFDVLNDANNENLVLDISQDISMFFINNLINRYVSSSKFRDNYDSFNRYSIDTDTYKKLLFELYPLPDVSKDFEIVKAYILGNSMENGQKYIDFIDEYISGIFAFEAQSWSSLSKEHGVKIAFNVKPWTQHKNIKENINFIKILDSLVDIYSDIDLSKEDIFFNKIDKIQELLHQIKSKYDSRLLEIGKIDFDTIITKTLDIMPKVRNSFKYIMVDEFQDTNETQFDIVKNSCNEDTNLFVVGDSKQSIYSFQGAEIEVFNNATNNTEFFSSIENMAQNHRSDGVILKNVNDIFDEILKKDENLKLLSQNYEAHPQDLSVFKKEREDKGSFRYLITPQSYGEEISELDTITQFVSEIYNSQNENYQHISKLITNKDKAIAIIFDSSTKMLELKYKLRLKGITAKVSVSDNFYHTKEINDIFNLLKAIDILSKNKEKINDYERYYVVGAMRSNILRCDDNSIKKYLDSNTVDEKLRQYIEVFNTMPLSAGVKYIYDDSNIMGVYTHFEDIEQRVGNLYKFLTLCKDYESSNEQSLYKFLALIENAIYFSEAKEDEAFFKSDNTKSIEICSIHSTKGLAYPLVLLANSDKGLYSQVTADSIKHNSFTIESEKKQIVGFSIDGYTPLSHRVLKEVDKRKHLAEKKRLLYVALTRAEHDVVVSAHLKATKGGAITLKDDSYLSMICDALDIDVDELFALSENYCIKLDESNDLDLPKKQVEYIEHSFESITFKSNNTSSATGSNDSSLVEKKSADMGTATHKIIELYWDSFLENKDSILDKMLILDSKQRESIVKNMEVFYESDVCKLLKNGVKHHFELEFRVDDKTGFIDFIYFDTDKNAWVIVDFKTGKESDSKNKNYQEQLDFYQEVMEHLGYKIVDSSLLWLGR
ncbi:MAG: UvrD-helicase domain-containing protein [Campylobacterota bacterium]|nr:UvrD-helicase domain-containing protein [Campylobacterota bacterium]